MAKDKIKKPKVRWKGVFEVEDRRLRAGVAFLLCVSCVVLAATQLGFAGIGVPGEYIAYAVCILLPVSLAALLLGTLWGTFVGFFAGVTMFVHAETMPLSFYELAFVTPITSIVMLTVAGFFLGVLFAFALRNNPTGFKRFVYIAIVCILVSWAYSIGFVINVTAALVVQLAEALQEGAVTNENLGDFAADSVGVMAYRLGSADVQAWCDAVLMIALCAVCDKITRLWLERRHSIGLRSQFAIWLGIVMFFTFSVTAAFSFVAITNSETSQAEGSMKGQTQYLCVQLDQANQHDDALERFLMTHDIDIASLPMEDIEELYAAVNMDQLLTGYDADVNGVVIISYGDGNENDIVMLSDIDRIEPGMPLGDVLESDVCDAVAESIETGRMRRIIYDDYNASDIEAQATDGFVRTSIAYLTAGRSGNYTVTVIKPATMVFANRGGVMGWTTLLALVLLLVVFLITFRLLNSLIVHRIDETNGVLSRITQGDLDARVEVYDTRELGSLSHGINQTIDALKGWIAEAESRMDAELATAKAIQEAALPNIFPPFPEVLRFDVYASMNAAREVGGDFYDFFLIGDDNGPDEGKLGFVIADVSGKGVPAALFMMKAKTQIRDYLASGMEVGEAVENANRQLCDGNTSGMFVTAWVGVLDYGTGHLEFVNAGHNPPLLWSFDEVIVDGSERIEHSGSWCWLKEKSGLPLGLFDGLPYKAHTLNCQVGDQLLLYTDGVTEAMSVDDELYGEDRLEEFATANYMMHPRHLVDAVRHDVARHAEGAVQSDDITILALEVGVPPEVTATLTVPAKLEELPHVNEFIHAELDRRLCPLRAQNLLDIAVEELFVNVCHYAYPDSTPDNPGTVQISYTYSADPPSIEVSIMDSGIPYDPLAKPDAVTPDDIRDVPIGGLGILMAKRSVDEMRYERVDGNNVVTIIKKW